MKQPSELTREELEDIVGRIRDILWQDPVTGELDPDRSWDVETIEWVSGVVEDAGLKPDPVRPASARPRGHRPTAPPPPCNDSRSRRSSRCGRPWRRSSARSRRPAAASGPDRGRSTARARRSSSSTAISPSRRRMRSWPDLADSYLQACRALGREPMLRDMDADEIPDDGGDAGESLTAPPTEAGWVSDHGRTRSKPTTPTDIPGVATGGRTWTHTS